MAAHCIHLEVPAGRVGSQGGSRTLNCLKHSIGCRAKKELYWLGLGELQSTGVQMEYGYAR